MQATAANRPTYTESGGLRFLQFDGVNDALATSAINFTVTDKMTLVVGVRKLSDALTAQIVLLNNPVTTNGAFSIMGPSANTQARLAVQTRGTVQRAWLASTFPYMNPAGINYVLSARLDNAATGFAAQIIPRLNQLPMSAENDGVGSTTAGNFSNAALHIGSQFGAANFYNGRLYGLIVRGVTSTPQEIAQTEVFMAGKSGMAASLRTEGDSYMGGSGGVVLPNTLAIQAGRVIANTAVGSSTMADIRDRVLLPANAYLLQTTTIFWDGSHNGYVSNPQYLGELQQAITALGHGRFVVIPPAVPFGSAPATAEFIAAGMQAAWPNNYLDWRSYIPNTAGVINLDQMLNYPTDTVHLNQTAMNSMSTAINAFITTKNW